MSCSQFSPLFPPAHSSGHERASGEHDARRYQCRGRARERPARLLLRLELKRSARHQRHNLTAHPYRYVAPPPPPPPLLLPSSSSSAFLPSLPPPNTFTIAAEVKTLRGKGVAKVRCGSRFSIALAQSGVLYGWGRGDDYQLGTGSTKDEHTPRVCDLIGITGR